MVSEFEVQTVIFTNVNGVSYTIKDLRPIVPATVSFEVDILGNEMLDSIASRQSVFGMNGENQTWKLFDQNTLAIIDNNFSLTNLRKIKVPVGV